MDEATRIQMPRNAWAVAIFIVATIALGALGLFAINRPASAADAIVADAEAGGEIYNSMCKRCHSAAQAPTLRGIINRPIASVASFDGYSDSLKSMSSMTWTLPNLDAFLTSPATFAPGTLMEQTLPEAQRRADLIAYLASLPPPRQD